MKDNQRRAAHFYIIFSDKVSSIEDVIEIMMEKLSYDKRVEEWGYLKPEDIFDNILPEDDNN